MYCDHKYDDLHGAGNKVVVVLSLFLFVANWTTIASGNERKTIQIV
jgi:hypothetical protein